VYPRYELIGIGSLLFMKVYPRCGRSTVFLNILRSIEEARTFSAHGALRSENQKSQPDTMRDHGHCNVEDFSIDFVQRSGTSSICLSSLLYLGLHFPLLHLSLGIDNQAIPA